MIGKLAVSRAGHDKDRLYVIVAGEAGWVYLCDGKLKPLAKPKKKKQKHIQIINGTVNGELLQRLQNGLPARDEEIKLALKAYVNKRDNKRDHKPDEG